MNDGILLLDKKTGITSFSSLASVKKSVNRKAGHTGTLDKFASGLMIVLTGSYTRLNEVFSGLDKTYEAVFTFGRETDTLDPEGITVRSCDVAEDSVLIEKLNASIRENFTGKILQRPPLYSAVHIEGRRAHEIARSGETAEMPEREVEIYSLEILGYRRPWLSVRAHVSKGTYIRSLARDLARSVGECAYVTELRRTSVGPYSVSEAVDGSDSAQMAESLSLSAQRLLRLDSVEGKELSEADLKNLSFGRSVHIDTVKPWVLAFSGGRPTGLVRTDCMSSAHSITLL